jgi:hypothetical protein
MADVILSGVVYESTPAGRVPIQGVDVYCEPCGAETHSWTQTDASGFYSFTGVWDDNGFPIRLWIGKSGYADPAGVPTPTPPNPSGAGWREVKVDGDTRFDIELVKRTELATISGHVYFQDPPRGEPMIGGVLIAVQAHDGSASRTNSNADGYYSLSVPSGSVSITASKEGYEVKTSRFVLAADTVLNFSLIPK